MTTAARAARSINWPQLFATAAAVLGPLIAYGMRIEGRLTVVEQHAQAEGHAATMQRLAALEKDAARSDQRTLDIIRRMDEQHALLREIAAKIERLQQTRPR